MIGNNGRAKWQDVSPVLGWLSNVLGESQMCFSLDQDHRSD